LVCWCTVHRRSKAQTPTWPRTLGHPAPEPDLGPEPPDRPAAPQRPPASAGPLWTGAAGAGRGAVRKRRPRAPRLLPGGRLCVAADTHRRTPEPGGRHGRPRGHAGGAT